MAAKQMNWRWKNDASSLRIHSNWIYEHECYLGVWMELCHPCGRIWWSNSQDWWYTHFSAFVSISTRYEVIKWMGCKWTFLPACLLLCFGNGQFKFSKKKDEHLFAMKSIRTISGERSENTFSVEICTMQCDALKCTRIELTRSALISSSVERAQDRRNNF